MSDALKAELESSAEKCDRAAGRNYLFAQAVFLLSILASFFSSILVSGELGTQLFGGYAKALTAILAALPAALLLANNTFRFEERTRWLWRKEKMAKRLLRKLRDSKEPDVEAISAEFSDLSEKLEAEWPAMGASSAQPSSRPSPAPVQSQGGVTKSGS